MAAENVTVRRTPRVGVSVDPLGRINVTASSVGPAGPPGPEGPEGPAGPEGPPRVVAFTHIQAVVASTWTVVHNLGWYPNTTVIDSGGSTVEGDVVHTSANQLTLTFSGAFTGTAYLS